MKKKFINSLWRKFLYNLYLWGNINISNYLKYLMYIQKYMVLFLFIICCEIVKYKLFVNLNLQNNENLKIKKNINIQKKYIQKGYKFKSLGIFFKKIKDLNNENLNNIYLKNLNKSYCYFLIRFKRKNLFLTLLNNQGNVLCKTNIGSCGFKKKVKYTGYAIKKTSKLFMNKIKKCLINNFLIFYKKKKKKDIEDKNYIEKKFNNIKFLNQNTNINLIIKKIRKKKYIKNININNKKIKLQYLKDIKENKKIIWSKLLQIKISKNLINYRNYYYNLKNLLKKNLKIIIRIKSSLKFWGFRFIIYGLIKQFSWFRGLEVRLPIPHSTSLRLKKKRRL